MRRLLLLVLVPVSIAAACGAPPEPVPPPSVPPEPPASAAAPAPLALSASSEPPAPLASASASASSPGATAPVEQAKDAPCPADMVFVDGSYCTKVERKCLRKELNKPNHLEICHAFEHETKCVGAEEKRTFCIDKYEYPNQEGGHPSWMVSWWDAQATCESKGKRLCYASEWITACEGPERTPFPYGWERDQTACNIDNTYINPRLSQMYSSNPAVSSAELERIDQSVPSGSMPRCKSAYGVHDLTGNFDEWVTREDKATSTDKSKWAGLKGGAWGHVRNACRPMTTSHAPEFTYYFVSFRCCADAQGHAAYQPRGGPEVPAVKAADRAPVPVVKNAPGPSKHKVQPENRRLDRAVK